MGKFSKKAKLSKEHDTTEDELESGHFIGHFYCIAEECKGKKECGSSDALAVYEHDGTEEGEVWYDATCYSCGQPFSKEEVHNSSIASELGVEEGEVVERKNFKRKPKADPITLEQAKQLIKKIGYKSNGYRGIKDEYNKFFGHLTKLNSQGEVVARYYPETVDGVISGYKCRNHPKDFRYGKIGRTGKDSDLSGQVKFKNGGKYVLLVGGEEDKVAAYQMLRDSQIKRKQDHYDPIAVVSPTTGEGSTYRQIARHYEWFDQFDHIVIGMDNDEAGKKATAKICEVLPDDKIKIATWSGKDPNSMLLEGREVQFVQNFYNAKEFLDCGIKSSADADLEVEEFLKAPKITLPPYLHKLQDRMRGGIKSTGAIVNIIGDTSIGKTFLTDNLLKHWTVESPITPTVISLERTAGEFMVDMYSLFLSKNLSWFKDGEEAWDYLQRPEVKEQTEKVIYKETGEPRFHIIDERDGNIKSLKKSVDRARKQYDSRFIIFDPLTDFLRSLGTEEQEDFMMWQKLLKKDGIVFLNVLHTRKPPTDKEGKVRRVTEYDALGSGTFVQSADINIVLNRDKMASDPIERNTTYLDMPKCRGGLTGQACKLYYDHETRQQYDLDDYLAEQESRNNKIKKVQEGESNEEDH